MVLDDGSDEKNTSIYKKFIKSQNRIKYIYKKNQGIIISSILLTKIAKKTHYDFFAKMDGDDISDKNRIKKQINLLRIIDNENWPGFIKNKGEQIYFYIKIIN